MPNEEEEAAEMKAPLNCALHRVVTSFKLQLFNWEYLLDKRLDPKHISQLTNTYNSAQPGDASCYRRGADLKSQQVC